ncbi:MAG TPA: hypothetical protein VIL26_04000 [Clostridia bacterium]
MAQTTKQYQIIQKVSASDSLLLHPETDADIVLYDNTESALTATNTKTAIDEIAAKVKSITDGGVVTGVKGNAESEYRKGQVNITATNIGAESLGAVDEHNINLTAHSDIRGLVSNAQGKADSAYAIAEGRQKAGVFETVSNMTTVLKTADSTAYKVGDNLYIKDIDVPDYWISAVLETNTGTYGYYEISRLETAKVDLTDYQTITDSAFSTTDKTVSGAVNEVKATADSAKSSATANAFDISNIVNGTTKVPKAAAADTATSSNTANIAGKWTTARTIDVSVGSGIKSDGSAISGTGSQSIDGSADKSISIDLGDSGITEGTYSAIEVNSKGIAIAGGQMIEIGASGQATPSASLATGGLFFKVI